MPARDYDVVLYGAGGFTGRQTVAYFARHAPAALRWAIAGRHRARLEAALRDAGGVDHIDLIIADSRDPASIDAFAARTSVVLSTAGPFALYGTPVVDACVRCRTHYVDITGETAWAAALVTAYHARAAADGTRIIPFCGFDSVPSDLGAFLTARHLRERHGVPCAGVRAYFQMRGGLNGGTVASALHLIESGGSAAGADRVRPAYDETIGAWVGPFVMAPINEWVVARSMALTGEAFAYRERTRYGPPLARVKAVTATAMMGVFEAALRHRASRRLLKPLLPKPGSGPSTDTMNRGWFACDVVGATADGREARGVIRNQGDPGNRSTVTFVCESALALALDAERLPGGPRRGGLLTPSTGLGDVLVARLRGTGVTIAIPSTAGT